MFKLRDFSWKRSILPSANCVAFAFKWETTCGRTQSPNFVQRDNLSGSRGFKRLYESEKVPPDHCGINDFCCYLLQWRPRRSQPETPLPLVKGC
jgi:hypothetical protein